MRMDWTGTAPPLVRTAAAIALLLAILPGTAAADAIPLDARGLPVWEIRAFSDFPVRIEIGSRADLEALLKETPIATFDREQIRLVPDPAAEGGYRLALETRVTGAEAAALEKAGRTFEALPDREREVRGAMEAIWAEQAREGGDRFTFGDKGVYHTEAQIGALLYQAMIDHPAIADTFIIGSSVQGRPIWGIRISDNIGSEEAEPEVRLASSLHGNEPPGAEMLLYLVEFLTNEYGTDSDAAFLVNNFDLHIIPYLNPDGHVLGQRYNANGVDLNRNYPVPNGSIGDDGTYTEQIETIHFKNYGYDHHFVISENGHSGTMVVNYPWDYTYTLAPDNDAIIQMSLEYSRYNLPMYNGPFPQGITNGADWYVVEGSLQDWSYHETGAIDVTIEYSIAFAPPASALDSLWLDDNKQSFIHYIKSARYGVNGIVTGSDTGLPLDATISVAGLSKAVTTDPDFGDYYKLLETGTYDISYSASGYITKTLYDVPVAWGTPTVRDVELDPIAYGDVAGHVWDSGTSLGLTASVEVRTYPGDVYVTTVQSDAGNNGAYTVHLVYGEYNFHVSKVGYTTIDRVLTVDEPNESEDFLLGPIVEAVLFEDDFEGGAGQWNVDWALTTASSHSPTNSMTDSPGGNYPANDSSVCVMLSPVDLTEAESCSLSFWAKWTLETNWDCVRLQISTNGGSTWTSLSTAYTQPASGQGKQKPTGSPIFEGTQATWVRNAVGLSAYQSATDVRFRFVLLSDGSTQKDGFYFDDFAIKGVQVATGVEAGAPPSATRLLANAPNPFNPTTTLRFELAEPSAVDLRVYDIGGRLVRTLVDREQRAIGSHETVWDGRNDAGDAVSSGIYLYRLEAGAFQGTKKMTLIR
ncbi:MAG: T9SS C-terminal target domain-containing protein [Candidatus Latescibacterota bacterium]|nr:MAG: T9SS C-terminal target domain-containing protein [Candidatus Latescibacterota bacterium]